MESHYPHLINKSKDVLEMEWSPVHASQDVQKNKDISELKFPE